MKRLIPLLCLLSLMGCTDAVLGKKRPPDDGWDDKPAIEHKVDKPLAAKLKDAFGGKRQEMADCAALLDGMAKLVRSNAVKKTGEILAAQSKGRDLLGYQHNEAVGEIFKLEFAILNPPRDIRDDSERDAIAAKFEKVRDTLLEILK